MGNGIAYGGLVGLPGREHDLATFGLTAMKSLKIALCAEAFAVAIVWWVFAARKSFWLRLGIALGLAIVADACTYSVVRG